MLEEVLVNGSGTGLHEILLLAKLLKTYTKGDSIFLNKRLIRPTPGMIIEKW